MRYITFRILFLVMTMLAGCSRFRTPSNQWMLVAYSAEKGYMFRKDGMTYRMRCSQADATKEHDNHVGDDNGACSDILPYMLKAVPLHGDGVTKDHLIFYPLGENDLAGYYDEFVIVEVKVGR